MSFQWVYDYPRSSRLVFGRFFDLRGHLGNVEEKPTRKSCFSREKKHLTLCIYLCKILLGDISLMSTKFLYCIFMRNRY